MAEGQTVLLASPCHVQSRIYNILFIYWLAKKPEHPNFKYL